MQGQGKRRREPEPTNWAFFTILGGVVCTGTWAVSACTSVTMGFCKISSKILQDAELTWILAKGFRARNCSLLLEAHHLLCTGAAGWTSDLLNALPQCHSRIACCPRMGGLLSESLVKDLEICKKQWLRNQCKYYRMAFLTQSRFDASVEKHSQLFLFMYGGDVLQMYMSKRQGPGGVTQPRGTAGELPIDISPVVEPAQLGEPWAGCLGAKAEPQGAGGWRLSSPLCHWPSKPDPADPACAGMDYEGAWSGWMSSGKTQSIPFSCDLGSIRHRCSTPCHHWVPLPTGKQILPKRRS